MQAIIKPGSLKGTVHVPPSKSMMQRACAGALLHRGRTVINNPGSSDDDKAALNIIQQLGAWIITSNSDKVIIGSDGVVKAAPTINCGESGLSARLFVPIAALYDTAVYVDGHGSLLERPMHEFAQIFTSLNVTLSDFTGSLPFFISGPLQARSITVDGSTSSQFLTGLLFALTASAVEPVTITVDHLKSKPYIDLTLDVLAQFGKKVEHDNYERFYIDPSKFEYMDEVVINIENDWSSAAYWAVGAAINGSVTMSNLSLSSHQADKQIMHVLKTVGADMEAGQYTISLSKSSLKAFSFDATDSPDLFPILAVLASCCLGESYIKGLHRLKHKESDRDKSIREMLDQLGVVHRVEDDTLRIMGRDALKSCVIDGHNDHRIVMSAAIASLAAKGDVIINDAQAISKSYPLFFDHLGSLGAGCYFKP